jgi:hypothetical protein
MRLALIATGAAALVAIPLAVGAASPQMSGDQFLTAVRCAAYEDVTRPDAELGALKMQLNAEARRQPAETAAQAQAEVDTIARQAVNTNSAADAAMISRERAAACAGSELATGAAGSTAA